MESNYQSCPLCKLGPFVRHALSHLHFNIKVVHMCMHVHAILQNVIKFCLSNDICMHIVFIYVINFHLSLDHVRRDGMRWYLCRFQILLR
jgi:hypothetical protein